MQHSKKKPMTAKSEQKGPEPSNSKDRQSIEGDSKVSSNLKNRSKLYWLFSCCGSSIHIERENRESKSL